MQKKWKVLLLALVLALSVGAFAACSGDGEQDGQKDDPGQTQTDETNGYGYLCIEDVKVTIDSNKHATFAEIDPYFTKPEKAEPLTYTYDTSAIKIENNIVTPLKRESQTVNVRAKSEHFNVVFGVEVEYRNLSGNPLYDLSAFTSGISSGQAKCRSITPDTTLFIGDSFMDDYYIGEYMESYAADKDVINAGISSTTSYHWEAMFSDIIGKTAPKNIVLHIGTNNFYDASDGVEFTEESLTRLMMYLHTSYPSSEIYWFNITQRVNTAHAGKVDETNTYMANWCARYDWITCVDTCSLVTAGMLCDDGIHPKTETYKVFTDALAEAGCEIVSKGA